MRKKKQQRKRRQRGSTKVLKKVNPRFLVLTVFSMLTLGGLGYLLSNNKSKLVSPPALATTPQDIFNNSPIFINSAPVNTPQNHAYAHLTKNDYQWATRVRDSNKIDKKRLDNAKTLLKRICVTEQVLDLVGEKKFKELSDAIKSTWVTRPGEPAKQVKYENLHNMHKLGVISQYLKDNIMKYDHEGKTSGMLVTEIFQTGKGSCASMPILYAALCEYMEIPVSLVTIGDHCFARYYEDNTWINIELTVDGRTGVGVPDATYLEQLASGNMAYSRAVESGLDMKMLSLDEMTGLMYANKTSYLFKKNGYRDGNINGLWKAACFALVYNPSNWMHAENWKKVRNIAVQKSEESRIKMIKSQLVNMGVKSSGNPFNFDFKTMNTLSDFARAMNKTGGMRPEDYALHQYSEAIRERELNPFAENRREIEARKNMEIFSEKKRKNQFIKQLQFELESLEEKQKRRKRNDDVLQQIEMLKNK